jgi:hypothetical protein
VVRITDETLPILCFQTKAPQHVVGNDREALDECRTLVGKYALDVPAHAWGQVRPRLSESNQHRVFR